MKARIIVISCCLLFQRLCAQKGFEDMVKTESDFAADAVANGVKDAFLRFLDSAGIVFDNGYAINGREFWNKKEKVAGILDWRPLQAEVAASKELGLYHGALDFSKDPF